MINENVIFILSIIFNFIIIAVIWVYGFINSKSYGIESFNDVRYKPYQVDT